MIVTMTKSLILLIIITMGSIILSTTAVPTETRQDDLSVATREMQKANYFTFVMLINTITSPSDYQQISKNITFLMPHDRILSNTIIDQNSIPEFLFRHSIPTPLLFEQLERIPNGSVIPSSQPGYVFKINNGGRRSYYLNNVKIISPNLCTAGSSIRCHGIDAVLEDTNFAGKNSSFPASPLPSGSHNQAPELNATSPSHHDHRQAAAGAPKSVSSHLMSSGMTMKLLMTLFMVYIHH